MSIIDKCYCSNDKYLWIAGAGVLGILLIISAIVFEWVPEIDGSHVVQIIFWLFYGFLGFGLLIVFAIIGGLLIRVYCNYDPEKIPYDESNMKPVALIVGMMFLLFSGIIIILIIDNWDQAIEKLDYDIERQKNKSGSSSYFKYNSESDIKQYYPKKYRLFNDWILLNDCESLVDWAERNYAHEALSYANKLIKENCEIIIPKKPMCAEEGDYCLEDQT